MIHSSLLNPKNIVVVGGSDNPNSPGGKIIDNLLTHSYKGNIFVVNPKKDNVKDLPTYHNVLELPSKIDLAIIAIASKYVEETVKILTEQKQTKAFIIISAGFSDVGADGKALEERIVLQIKKHGGTLLGPNNIGLINQHYAGVFTTPVPKLNPNGVDLVSGSGATAVFIIEAAMQFGLTFNSVWTVGNSAMIGVEEVLEHLDKTHTSDSPQVKMLYLESIKNPIKLLQHARSLIDKGCRIVAVKAGSSSAGSRAASSHTGALASSDLAVDALFDKAGIIRAFGRYEMIQIAGVLQYGLPDGNRMAVVTHAGGPGVMLTDVFEKNNIQVPELKGKKAAILQDKLLPGSSVANPIDFLATGTAVHLDQILTALEEDFDQIDAISVIFGSPGLFRVFEVYDVLNKHIDKHQKPIYPILPSLVNVQEEIKYFQDKNKFSFADEVLFGQAFVKAFQVHKSLQTDKAFTIENTQTNTLTKEYYLSENEVNKLLTSVNLPMVEQAVFTDVSKALEFAKNRFPVVLKVVGVLHKSDVNGVRLNIQNEAELRQNFTSIMQIKEAKAVMVQPQKKGMELFIGVKKEAPFGHLILFGLGGIYIEVLKDFQTLLLPVSKTEVLDKIQKLKMYDLLKGVRGKQGIDTEQFAELVVKVSNLIMKHPEISELDLNPVLASASEFYVVDARIKL